jgi:superfamily II DNA/RNA helicase
MRFEELNLEPNLMDGLSAMNFQEMTPVQEQSIPLILEGKDIIACAQTGTGKTAAYLLPLLNKMMTEEHDADAVNAIVMAPTRELAQQIDQQLEGFSYFLSVSSVAVYGGNDASAWEQQKRALKLGADFVIATPGRLISHMSLDNVDFSKVRYFVLDEADRMLDMGFYDDIISIVKKLPKERQTIMFSATMPPKIKKLAETILQEPQFVDIAISKPAENIRQEAYVCYEAQKLQLLTSLLKSDDCGKTILFSSSKLKVKEIARQLRRNGFSVAEIHSDLEQAERDEALLDFKSGKVAVLVATDIVSRGIDIDDIEMVVNYDVPRDVEDYIHRIGRTARANRTGRGITFVSEDDQQKFARVERFIEKNVDKLPLPEGLGAAPEYLPKISTKGAKNGRNRRSKLGGKNKSATERREKNTGSKSNAQSAAENPESKGVSSAEITEQKASSKNKRRRPFWKKKKDSQKNVSESNGSSIKEKE